VRGFSSRAAQAIRDYDWPGNVRELINRVRRAMVMAEGRLILPQDLGLGAATCSGAAAAGRRPYPRRTRRHRRQPAARRPQHHAGARDLGVSRMTLYRLLAKHGMSAPSRASYTGGQSE
jgi:DNA-binding NtrC family response regulator